MKKLFYLFVTMLEVFCLAGAYGVHFFTRKRMGMARYVIYKNREWEAAYSGFIWYYSVETLRAHYMIGALLAPAVLLQIIKTVAGTWMWKHEA